MLSGVGLAALIVAVAVVPWGMRNYHVFGHFIFTRSNFGLELAAGNADDSNGFSGTGAGWILHPHDNLPAAERLAKVGEIEYMKEMKEIAISWISSHPLTFLVLTVKRFGLCMTVGPAWLPTIGASATAFVYLIFGALKTISLSVSLVLRYRPLSALMYCVAPLAPYVITHVNERYPFVVLFTSIALISITATQLLTRVAPHLEFPSVVPR
jgi:hypothetical protein